MILIVSGDIDGAHPTLFDEQVSAGRLEEVSNTMRK